MNDTMDLADDSEHIVEPPIIDHLFLDEARGVYGITFVPQDDVSSREKELVEIDFNSSDGRRVTLRLQELSKLTGGRIQRLFHAGGGDFRFTLAGNRSISLAEMPRPWIEAYVHLQDLGMIAQIAYRDVQLSKAGAA